MSRNAIIEKISKELHERIASERQVVYFIVELRKLIEISGDGAKYKTLKFWCDWVAHPVLSGSEAQKIVRNVDDYQKAIESGQGTNAEKLFDSYPDLREILTLSKLRRDLSLYLKQYGFPSQITDDDAEWINFLIHYTRVIEDCPLKCVSQGLKYVDHVSLTVTDLKASERQEQFVVEWSWTSKTNAIGCVVVITL